MPGWGVFVSARLWWVTISENTIESLFDDCRLALNVR
jgi:hypothetical protein